MVKLMAEYNTLKDEFLKEHPYCQWFLAEKGIKEVFVRTGSGPIGGIKDGFRSIEYRIPLATEIHHAKGRGKYLLDTSTWMSVSSEGHRAIHADPKTSYEKGYMLPRR